MFMGMERKVIIKAYFDSKWMFDMVRARASRPGDTPITLDTSKTAYPDFLAGKISQYSVHGFRCAQTAWDPIKASGLPNRCAYSATLDNLKVGCEGHGRHRGRYRGVLRRAT